MKSVRAVVSGADFGIRLAFFVVAPFMLVIIAYLLPIAGALVSTGLLVAVFLAGPWLRRHVTGGLAGRLLKRAFAFEAYYQEHRIRPFLYYVFYPLLLPYRLFNKEAREERKLFKAFTRGSLLILGDDLERWGRDGRYISPGISRKK